jgi:hypothetical protein
MRVHEAEAAETTFGRAKAADVREHQLSRVSDDDVIDLARAMDERADLTPGLDARRDERARQLRGRNVVERDAAPINALERLRRRRR